MLSNLTMELDSLNVRIPAPLVYAFKKYVMKKHMKLHKVFAREIALALYQYLKSKGFVNEDVESSVILYCWDILDDETKQNVKKKLVIEKR